MRGMVIYFVMSIFRRPSTPPPNSTDGGIATNLPKGAAVNLFTNGTLFDLYVFLSEDPEFVNFNDSQSLIWTKKDLVYGDWESGPNGDGTYTFDTKIDTTEALQNNGSIYLHSFVGKIICFFFAIFLCLIFFLKKEIEWIFFTYLIDNISCR